MNNTLIIQLIKNNIKEIQNLIDHFQNEEEDLKGGFSLIETRLESLNKDIEVLKANLSNASRKAKSNTSINNSKKEDVNIEKTIFREEIVTNEVFDEEVSEQTSNGIDSDEKATQLKTHVETEQVDHLNQSTLNDKLQAERVDNLQEKIQKSKIIDIQSAIGINDQFLFIRELFNNNSEDYRKAINFINSANNCNTIFEHFDKTKEWDKDEDSVVQFFDLIKRKFE